MRKLAYIFGIALFFFGCAGGQSLNSSLESIIQKNVTTKKEIFNQFGLPFKKGIHEGYAAWTYKVNFSRNVVILFDE